MAAAAPADDHSEHTVMDNGPASDTLHKVVQLHTVGAGTTCLATTFATGTQFLDSQPTRGILKWHPVVTVDGEEMHLEIWDPSGQSAGKSFGPPVMAGAAAFVLAYAVNDRASFNCLHLWLEPARRSAPNAVFMLVATKADMDGREVDEAEGRAYAQQHGLAFMETSVANNQNVREVYETLAAMIKRGPGAGLGERAGSINE